MAEKTLIVLQENTGKVAFPFDLGPTIEKAAEDIIDLVAETFEDMKTNLQAADSYNKVYLLTDIGCTRERLLDVLVAEAKINRIVDLLVIGHGRNEELLLHNNKSLTGTNMGNIRSLITDAKALGAASLDNLRMVFMCNCYGGSLNDDWLAIGAKVSVGSIRNNYMPEPMITFFMKNWINGQKAKDAANNAYETSKPFWLPLYQPTVQVKYKKTKVPYPCPTWNDPLKMCEYEAEIPDGMDITENIKITDSQLVVSGNGDLQF
ncbi:hypothetical protein ACSFXN_18270 [Planococcus sp. 1R117A]|uniref:hypothetical protein n=1 Tax=Planococcus sp. 1R117A TaxID=3447020 RepID=UPI003EDBC903